MYSTNWPMVFFCERCRGRSNFLLCPRPGCRKALLKSNDRRAEEQDGGPHTARAGTEEGISTDDGY
jgi:hypothetical protein